MGVRRNLRIFVSLATLVLAWDAGKQVFSGLSGGSNLVEQIWMAV